MGVQIWNGYRETYDEIAEKRGQQPDAIQTANIARHGYFFPFCRVALTVSSDPGDTVRFRVQGTKPDKEKTDRVGSGAEANYDGVLPTYFPSKVISAPEGVEVKLHFTSPGTTSCAGLRLRNWRGGWRAEVGEGLSWRTRTREELQLVLMAPSGRVRRRADASWTDLPMEREEPTGLRGWGCARQCRGRSSPNLYDECFPCRSDSGPKRSNHVCPFSLRTIPRHAMERTWTTASLWYI